jgi:hypothetical protein
LRRGPSSRIVARVNSPGLIVATRHSDWKSHCDELVVFVLLTLRACLVAVSIQAMSACWGPDFPVRAEGLSSHAVRVVALAVADVVNDMHGHEFYAARKKLAEKVGMDRDTVGDVLKHLVEAGVLSVVELSPGKPVRYRWNIGTYGDPPQGVRSSTVGGAVTSPHRNTNRNTRDTGGERRDYRHAPPTLEEQRAKYGVEI